MTFTLLGVEEEDMMVSDDLTDTQMREKIEAVARMADARPDCAWVSVVILSDDDDDDDDDNDAGERGHPQSRPPAPRRGRGHGRQRRGAEAERCEHGRRGLGENV